MRIYDIGANCGAFTEANLKKYDNAEFILIEANPNLIEVLKNKFNNQKNVKIINNCVSSVDNEYINFYISPTSTISTASIDWTKNSRFKNYTYYEPIKLNTITIDTLIKTYGKSDYLKIDVEGYEFEAISGIKKYLGLLSFEWAEEFKEHILKSILYLHSIGYNHFWITYDDNYLFVPSNFVDFETILKQINENMNENNQERWGMVYTK